MVALAVLANQDFGLLICQVLNALMAPEVEFDPHPFVLVVDQAEGVAAKTVHMAVAARKAAIAHHDCDLMQRLRKQCPEVPVILTAAHARARIAFDRVVEVGKTQRIAEEEHRGVVAHQIPIAFLGVELQRETADVALSICGATLASDR